MFITSRNWKQSKHSLTGSVVYSHNGTGDRREKEIEVKRNEPQLRVTSVNFSCVKRVSPERLHMAQYLKIQEHDLILKKQRNDKHGI